MHRPVLQGKLPEAIFEFLNPALRACALLVAPMLNTLQLIVGDLSLIPELRVDLLERFHLLFQRVLLCAKLLQLGPDRIDIDHRFIIFTLRDTSGH